MRASAHKSYRFLLQIFFLSSMLSLLYPFYLFSVSFTPTPLFTINNDKSNDYTLCNCGHLSSSACFCSSFSSFPRFTHFFSVFFCLFDVLKFSSDKRTNFYFREFNTFASSARLHFSNAVIRTRSEPHMIVIYIFFIL